MPRASYLENLRAAGLDKAYREKDRLAQAARRSVNSASINTRRREIRHMEKLEQIFLGCDGEGGGLDEHGRQLYRLLRVGPEYLFNNNKHLTTQECLAFLVAQAVPRTRYFSYAFDYDVTMICRDLNRYEQTRLVQQPFKRNEQGMTVPNYTTYGPYALHYLRRKEFSVFYEDRHIVIEDVFTNFQCPFLKALQDWNIGTPEEIKKITEGKESRSNMDLMTETEIEYNRLECELLEQLMREFNKVLHTHHIAPNKFEGPGLIAQKLMQKNKVPKNKEYKAYIPPEVNNMAQAAYYGGRFEVTRIGKIDNVYEYDINSAYPYSMLFLPCLLHTQWHKVEPTVENMRERCIAKIAYEHIPSLICNYPQRTKSGVIRWPTRGIGTYWGREIFAGLARENCMITPIEIWHYEQCCDCQPFDYVNEVYAERVRIGKGTKGYALKLALNSQYGKIAQSIGEPQYANAIWAGMITAYCRAMLLDAARQAPNDIVMMATDGIYSTIPLNLPQRDKVLGDWEMKLHPELFIIKPGIYFTSAVDKDGKRLRPKTRGIPLARVVANEDKFRSTLQDWLTTLDPYEFFTTGKRPKFPGVEVPINTFIGLNLALHRKANEEMTFAGRWINTTKIETFDFYNKRRYHSHNADVLSTQPINPREPVDTYPYNRRIGGALPGEPNAPDFGWQIAARDEEAMVADQPDDYRYTESTKGIDTVQ